MRLISLKRFGPSPSSMMTNTRHLSPTRASFEGAQRGAADRRVAGDAGIGEHDVELAEGLDRLRHRVFGRRDIGGVGDHGERIRPEFLRGRLQRRLVARPVITTRAPSATNSLAVASPMPLLPPVISAVLFFNRTGRAPTVAMHSLN